MHYVRGDLYTLREQLQTFVNSNMRWIHEVYGDILQKCNVKLEDYVNSPIEQQFKFDGIAITVVCVMNNIHCSLVMTLRSILDN